MSPLTATKAWLTLMRKTLAIGEVISPRGKSTKDLEQETICVDMKSSVITVPERKLSYRFMAAEAYWILSGSKYVADIAPYNSHISQFSDDGTTFFGAYGPKVTGQLEYVISKLKEDPFTRQAGLTIWRENPPQTKDYPCTITMFFHLRNHMLNCHVFMRSSDQWLGIPYDIFNFSCISYMVCSRLNNHPNGGVEIMPGKLYITAASSHLYEENWAAAQALVDAPWPDTLGQVPRQWCISPMMLMSELNALRSANPLSSLKWWES